MTTIGYNTHIHMYKIRYCYFQRRRVTVATLHRAQLGLQEDRRCHVVVAVFVVEVSEMKRKASNSGVHKIANIKIYKFFRRPRCMRRSRVFNSKYPCVKAVNEYFKKLKTFHKFQHIIARRDETRNSIPRKSNVINIKIGMSK